MMQELKERYETYVAQALEAKQKAGLFAGILGFNNGPQNHPCHMAFYEDVQKWIAKFMTQDPDTDACYEAVRFVLCASAELGQADSYGMMFAAQGLVRELLPRLTGAQNAWLQEYYDAHYPPKDRMPVQKEIYKRLKKGAKGR